MARLPWWVHALLAVFSYGVLHHYALFLQYVVPLLFIGAAVGSALGRSRSTKVRTGVLPGSSVREMRWQDFEALVAEGFRLQGHFVIGSGGGTDDAVDLLLQKGEEKFLVQCRHWRAPKVDVGAVRDFHGTVSAKGAAGGFLVTAGEFTAAATEFARACGVQLVNGPKLVAMLEQARQTVTLPLRIEPRLGSGTPPCPRCSRAMVQRVAQQGAQAGKPFWGCPAFPDCRGSLPA